MDRVSGSEQRYFHLLISPASVPLHAFTVTEGLCWGVVGGWVGFTGTVAFGICWLTVQRPPSFVAPGNGFMGDSVSTGWAWGKVLG